MPTTLIERQLLKLRRRIAQASRVSGSLADNLAPIEPLVEEILALLDRSPSPASLPIRPAVEAQTQSLDKILALDGALARAAEFQRLESKPVGTPELRRITRLRSLDFSTQLRVLYAFTLSDLETWRSIAPEILDHAQSEVLTASLDPVVRALRTLADGEWSCFRPSHRIAAEQAHGEPLGFARLVIEEGLTLLRASEWPNFAPLRFVGELLDDPFLTAAHPEAHADLMARASFYLAEHQAIGPSDNSARIWLDRGRAWYSQGTGSNELQALYFEVRAVDAVSRGRIHRALRNLLRANVLLTELQPLDRRVEIMLRYALVLAHHPGAASQAPLVLETALTWLSKLESELQPNLRLRLLHFLAEIETRAAFGKVAALHPLELEGESPSPELIVDHAQTWADALTDHLPLLRRAATHIRLADPLYEAFATQGLKTHRSWIIGRTLLPTTPELASIYLLDAHRGFELREDAKRSALCRRDLLICHALLGQQQQCSEVLSSLAESGMNARQSTDVLEDFALLHQDLLPEAGGRQEESAVLSDVLDLANVVPFDGQQSG